MNTKQPVHNNAIHHYFCLDVGGTSTRGALFNAKGEELARAKGPAGALSRGARASAQAILAVWEQLGGALDGNTNIERTALWAGVAGISLTGRPAQLREGLTGFSRVGLVSDGYAALLGATGGKPGALISVGTGVIAQRLHEDETTLALGGWGLPAGDMGGGAWMGLELFGALSKYLDGVALSPPLPGVLADALMDITGRDYAQIQHWHHHARAQDFAALVPIAVAKSKEDDAFCTKLLDRAAQEITALGRALFGETGSGLPGQTIHLAGGLGPILQPACATQSPEFVWDSAPVDPIRGVYLLASGQAPMEEVLTRPRLAAEIVGAGATPEGNGS